jgi:hypothetical protein
VIGALPPVADPRAAADVWVIRRYNYVGWANSYELTVDGSRVFGIRNNEHTAFLLPAGVHELGVRCFGGWFPIWHETKLRVSLRSGQKHFFAVAPSAGWNCASLRRVDAEAGSTGVSDTRYVPYEQLPRR